MNGSKSILDAGQTVQDIKLGYRLQMPDVNENHAGHTIKPRALEIIAR